MYPYMWVFRIICCDFQTHMSPAGTLSPTMELKTLSSWVGQAWTTICVTESLLLVSCILTIEFVVVLTEYLSSSANIEQPHNSVHLVVGGAGHMVSRSDVSNTALSNARIIHRATITMPVNILSVL